MLNIPNTMEEIKIQLLWLEEMELAFTVNRVANDRKVAAAVPRLKTQVGGNIDRWNDNTDNNAIAANFVPNFQRRYRTRAMKEGWAAGLEKRKQLPGGNNYPDRIKRE